MFDKYILVSQASPKTLWKFVKKQPWQAVHAAALIIGAILELTKGAIPRQISLQRQFATWCAEKANLVWAEMDTERCVYDLRKSMMKLLRIYNDPSRRVPRKYKHLAHLVAKFGCGSAGNMHEVREVPTDLLAQALPLPWSSHGSDMSDAASNADIAVVDLIDDSEESSSDDADVLSVPEDKVNFDSLEFLLFDRRRKSEKTHPDGSKARGSASALELEALFNDAEKIECEAPTPQEYVKLFKRPAGKKKKAKAKKKTKNKTKKAKAKTSVIAAETTDPGDGALDLPAKIAKAIPIDVLVAPYLSSPINNIFKKRVYSNAYHKIRAACTAAGLDEAKSKSLGQMIAREVRHKWVRIASS